MRYVSILLSFFLASQLAMADDMDSKACGTIAKACAKAGYLKKGEDVKKFWSECMKPVILGKSVKGVTVDANTVSSCRSDKINQMKQDLSDFEAAQSK